MTNDKSDPSNESRRDSAGIGAVVVSYRSSGDLVDCLQSLLRSPSLAAVVVVDNASDDGSAGRAREVPDDRVQVLELETNTGFAGGCNRGLHALPRSLEWVAFVNPDVRVDEACLGRCVDELDRHAELAAVAPRLMRPDGATVDSVGQVLRPRNLEVRDRGYREPLAEHLLRPRQVLSACGALAVFRREALEEVDEGLGPWAEHFFCFWEDLELGWRLTNRGWEIRALPQAHAVHVRGGGAAAGRGPLRWRRTPFLEACILSNRWMTLIRHLHPLDLLYRFPLLFLWDLALVSAGALRRPTMLGHLLRRLVLCWRELRQWRGRPRRRLAQLPW